MRDDLYNEVAKVAYELHEKRGWTHGNDVQDWLEAERIVLARNEKETGKTKSTKGSVAKKAKKAGR